MPIRDNNFKKGHPYYPYTMSKQGKRMTEQNPADKKLFARYLFEGYTQKDAYIMAKKGKTQAKPESLKNRAHVLTRDPVVQAEIDRLNAIAEKKAGASAEAIVAKFEDIAFDPGQKTEHQIQALDRLAKVKSLYSENQKVQVEVSMADREKSMMEWLEGLRGETEEPSAVVGGEQGQVDNG